MALMKLKDFYPNHQAISSDTGFDMDDIKDYSVYAQDNNRIASDADKVGSVDDVLVDDTDGRFRYFVVDTGFWVFGKKVLLPVGLATIDSANKRIYAKNLTKEQVENLPKLGDLEKLDYDYEEQVRGVYRPSVNTAETATPAMTPAATPATYDRNTYSYDRDPSLYNLNTADQESLRLYEERLIAGKRREKTGEVVVGKRVETETAHASIPVEKERVVIERVTPTQTVVNDAVDAFHEGAAVHMDVYEETPDIRKETVVREEVKVRKEVDRDTVTADETLRREELDLNDEGRSIVDKQL